MLQVVALRRRISIISRYPLAESRCVVGSKCHGLLRRTSMIGRGLIQDAAIYHSTLRCSRFRQVEASLSYAFENLYKNVVHSLHWKMGQQSVYPLKSSISHNVKLSLTRIRLFALQQTN